jgi:antitoxin ParD1/3/4
MAIVTISLPKSLKEFVDVQVAGKGYGDASEYLCSLLREAQQAEADARLEGYYWKGWHLAIPSQSMRNIGRALIAE